VFEAAGIEIINIPYQAPNANAVAERWVRSVREECLDHLIILNEHHLRRVLQEYTMYYNARRPHQGLAQDSPLGLEPISNGCGYFRLEKMRETNDNQILKTGENCQDRNDVSHQ
jgi:hypothetical protein